MHVVEGSWVPGASPSLSILIFKMGMIILVLQSCSKSWPPVGPTSDKTLPFTKCQLSTLKMSWFTRLAYLRKWHPRRYLAGKKETPRSVRSIPFLPLTVFFCWLSAFCCLCLCFGFSLLHTANLASRRKRLRNAEHRAPITLWDRSTEKSPPAWNQSHDSLSIRRACGSWFLCVEERTAGFSLIPPGHPINFLFQNTKLQTTLVGKGKRHLPKPFARISEFLERQELW